MARGLIRPTSAVDAVARARKWVGGRLLPKPPGFPAGTPASPLRYRLKPGFNGGKDPLAAHPGMPSYGNRVFTADCFGFVAWALGFDRYQPVLFPLQGGWLNTDGVLADALRRGYFFTDAGQTPAPGDIVVYGAHNGVGHVGVVTVVPAGWRKDDPETTKTPAAKKAHWGRVGVAHCSAGHDRRFGHAIAEDDAGIWAARGTFLRYRHQV